MFHVEFFTNYNGSIKSQERLVRFVGNRMSEDGISIIEAKHPGAVARLSEKMRRGEIKKACCYIPEDWKQPKSQDSDFAMGERTTRKP